MAVIAGEWCVRKFCALRPSGNNFAHAWRSTWVIHASASPVETTDGNRHHAAIHGAPDSAKADRLFAYWRHSQCAAAWVPRGLVRCVLAWLSRISKLSAARG